MPRNVDPAVRDLPGVRLLDLADLRATGTPATDAATDAVTTDLATADQLITDELDRYQRWLAGRAAAGSIRRLRADLDALADTHADQATRGLPAELRPLVHDQVHRAVRRLAHGPTKRLLQAAEAGDDQLVELLAGLFATRTAQA